MLLTPRAASCAWMVACVALIVGPLRAEDPPKESKPESIFCFLSIDNRAIRRYPSSASNGPYSVKIDSIEEKVNTIRLYRDDKPIGPPIKVKYTVSALAVSPDGVKIAVATSHIDETRIHAFNGLTGERIKVEQRNNGAGHLAIRLEFKDTWIEGAAMPVVRSK